MESLEHAMKRGAPIIAEYLGGAVTCDAYHMTDPRSDGLGVSMCIRKSLEDAGVSPEEVSVFCFLMNVYQWCRMTYFQHFNETLLESILINHTHGLMINYHILNNNAGQLYQCSCNINPGRRSGRG